MPACARSVQTAAATGRTRPHALDVDEPEPTFLRADSRRCNAGSECNDPACRKCDAARQVPIRPPRSPTLARPSQWTRAMPPPRCVRTRESLRARMHHLQRRSHGLVRMRPGAAPVDTAPARLAVAYRWNAKRAGTSMPTEGRDRRSRTPKPHPRRAHAGCGVHVSNGRLPLGGGRRHARHAAGAGRTLHGHA
eukprot:scaffold3782_cov301-Prasinococcus_capsulatus_cf.AAC.6